MVINKMLKQKINTYGVPVVRVAFNKKMICSCKKGPLEGNPKCKKCLGTGFVGAMKKQKIIIDTFDESSFGKDSSIGTNIGAKNVRIYSDSQLYEDEYIIVLDGNARVYKIDSAFMERYFKGKIEAFIGGATICTDMMNLLKGVRITYAKDWWCKL